MRISDWSSDVCSADLLVPRGETGFRAFDVDRQGWLSANVKALLVDARHRAGAQVTEQQFARTCIIAAGERVSEFLQSVVLRALRCRGHQTPAFLAFEARRDAGEIGRASCRERVCQYV